jgi:hypothetical protein
MSINSNWLMAGILVVLVVAASWFAGLTPKGLVGADLAGGSAAQSSGW